MFRRLEDALVTTKIMKKISILKSLLSVLNFNKLYEALRSY